jgi:hypothetical protein
MTLRWRAYQVLASLCFLLAAATIIMDGMERTFDEADARASSSPYKG